jgi:Ca-activated chloride channel family protein
MSTLPILADQELTRWQSTEKESGFGALSTDRGPLPLKAMDVQAQIDGLLAEVSLTQTFVNTHADTLEATYIFPLPDRGALTRFRLEVAGRVIDGVLKERGAARREYEQALREGHRAAITEEERPGVFTLRVGNLPPGEKAVVRLSLTMPLPYSDGEATFRFPLVVAPRYIPGSPLPGPSVGDGVSEDTDAVPDASRISPPVLLPGFPNPVRLGLAVAVPPSPLQPRDFRSSLHTVREQSEGEKAIYRLHPGERLDRDFILRFRLGADAIAPSLDVQPDATGSDGTFLLTLLPPSTTSTPARPRDLVFVLDRSGSMGGWKMVAARRAVARMIETLTDQDRFAVLAFDDRIETCPPANDDRLEHATASRRWQCGELLAGIEARGGTEMAQPLDRALTRLTESLDQGRDRVLVLITDGQVGNEDQILHEIASRAKLARIFTIGIDQAVNEGFLRRLSTLGGGSCTLVESEERLDAVMDQIHRHIGTPVLTDVRLEADGLGVQPDSLVPSRLPDLFAGTPLLVSGRFAGVPQGDVVVRGKDGSGRQWSLRVPARRVAGEAISRVYGRGRVRELEDRYAVGRDEVLEKQIVETSLRFGVLCRFTAFVAVDRSEKVNVGGELHQVVQPVEMPAGWAQPGVQMMKSACGAVGGAPRGLRRSAPAPSPTDPCNLSRPEADLADFYDMMPARLRVTVRGAFTGQSTVFREPARAELEAFLRRLHGETTGDPVTREAILRELVEAVAALSEEITQAPDTDPAAVNLAAAVLQLRTLLSSASPDPAEVLATWDLLRAALEAYYALLPATPGNRSGAFWK